ncbi:MAG TPA: NAD(+)/NADH kinase [Acidimicrobiales bacterium]
MSRVAVVAHRERFEAAALARQAAQWLAERGHELYLTPDDAAALDLDDLAADRPIGEANLLLSLGGDGTMLRAVDLLDGGVVPILGVNLGALGYLSEIEANALTAALDRFLAGDYQIDERMLLEVSVESSETTPPAVRRALNEAVVEKGSGGHTVRLAVEIDGAAFTTYVADGLIVATPTGSTAYSLSARGPIVSPRHKALVLTPVSPHMLFDRSLVLDPDEAVVIEVAGHREALLTLDGQEVGLLCPGDRVRCVAAAEVARFVRFSRQDFHQILKAKFGLSDR